MIIVTGGAGFIGSAVVWRLNRKGVTDVLIADETGSALKDMNLSHLKYRDYIGKGALLANLESGVYGDSVEGIIHLGACSSTTETNRDFLIANNFEYTKTLALWAVGRGTRFVYASTAATYGDGSAGYADDEETTRKLRPLNFYGESKQLFDLWALDNGLFSQICGLKYFNVYGPNEYHKGDMRSVVHKAFEEIRDTGRMRLFRSYKSGVTHGEQSRDFLYVKDAADVTLFCYEHGDANGLFNVGTGRARSFRSLAAAVFCAMAKEERIEYIEMPEHLREKYQYFTEARIERLRRAGYSAPLTPLEGGVRDYVKNYCATDAPYLGKGGDL